MRDNTMIILFILIMALKPGWIFISNDNIDPSVLVEVVDDFSLPLFDLPPKEEARGY